MRSALSSGGLASRHTEQEVLGVSHRPDVRATGFSIPTTHFEVRVAHSNRLVTVPELRRRGQSPDAFVEATWQWRLDHDYQGGPPPRAAYELIPAVASSYGGWHPAFARLWRGAVRIAAEQAGPSASQIGILWRTVGLLVVILQRQTFQVLAACATTLSTEVEGRFGRPLSETPEFWRVAPEAAVLWASEEFGYPDQRRGDVSRGGTALGPPRRRTLRRRSHLRAAGMRL